MAQDAMGWPLSRGATVQQREDRKMTGRWLPGKALVVLAIGLVAFTTVGEAQNLVSPMRIAEGPPGQVLVSDSRQDLVLAMDEDSLAPVWSFSVAGNPMAVGFAANLILIGNASTHNVEVYRLKGAQKGPHKTLEFQFNLGHTPSGTAGTIRTPSDLGVDKDVRLVFVVDSGDRKVKVFTLDGDAVTVFPAEGDEGPPLLSPTALAVDPQRREVLVSDYGDPSGSLFSGAAVPARIMVYTYGGQFLRRINGGPVDDVVVAPEARFERPQGLAIDRQGRVLMVEAVRGEVFVFDGAGGGLVGKLGVAGDGPGQLRLPLDVVLTGSGDLLVTNNMNGRVERLAGSGGRP